MAIRLMFLLAFLCANPSISHCQEELSSVLNEIINDPDLRHAGIGISIIDTETGQQIAAHQPQLSLVPASTLKVLTTATALAILGSDYQFKTEILRTGQLDREGTLNGHLIIRGFGDPTLGSDQMSGVADLEEIMERFRLAIQREGIRKINGYIIVDESFFDAAINAESWPWNDLGNYYASGAWGLNIHENLYYLKFRQKPELNSNPSIASIQPRIPGLQFRNHLESAGKGTGDNAYIFGAPYTFLRYIRGTIPVGTQLFTIKGSIPNPPLFAAQYFLQKLEEIGIRSSLGSTTIHEYNSQSDAAPLELNTEKLLYRHLSPKLQDIVNRANGKSINLYCESMLKTLGKTRNEAGSIASGLQVIRSYWAERGLDFSGCYLEDGSGLSPRNAVTPAFLARLLFKISEDPTLEKAFSASLPVAGVSGTLRSWLRNSPAQGKIFAKSGTMERVRAFTGYVTTIRGQRRAFAIIINNYEGSSTTIKRKLERLMLHIYKY